MTEQTSQADSPRREAADPNIELRSERVRSIVGQIPPALLRYGIGAIGATLIFLALAAHLIPYREVYRGEASLMERKAQIRPLQDEGTSAQDSITLRVLLRFEGKRMERSESRCEILLITPTDGIAGRIVRLSPTRDTLSRQEAFCCFPAHGITPYIGQTHDFRITIHSGTLLQRMLGKSRVMQQHTGAQRNSR